MFAYLMRRTPSVSLNTTFVQAFIQLREVVKKRRSMALPQGSRGQGIGSQDSPAAKFSGDRAMRLFIACGCVDRSTSKKAQRDGSSSDFAISVSEVCDLAPVRCASCVYSGTSKKLTNIQRLHLKGVRPCPKHLPFTRGHLVTVGLSLRRSNRSWSSPEENSPASCTQAQRK